MSTSSSALARIVKQQRADGSFAITSQTGSAPVPHSVDLTLHALLLDLLVGIPVARAIVSKLAQYLTDTLQFQDFSATLAITDTRAIFHALAAVYEYDAARVPPEVLAASIYFLTSHELAVGGPYVNALAHDQTPELATNISISRFVHAIGGPFPKLMAYIATTADDSLDSPYFTVTWPTRLQLVKLQNSAGLTTNDRSENQLFDMSDSSRPSKYVCMDPWQKSTVSYGMAALQEPLRISATTILPRPVITPASQQPAGLDTAQARVLMRAQTLDTYDPLIAAHVKTTLSRVAKADSAQEIGLLALRFAPALNIAPPPRAMLEHLGIANLYNWAAYTVYDDVLDDGVSDLLPSANTALRTAVGLFHTAVPVKTFRQFVDATFNLVDAANAWELAYCRFEASGDTIIIGQLPDYGELENLYGRSLTHCLPVVGALVGAGLDLQNSTLTSVLQAFKDYLVVRQLSDDLHDWREDLRNGHISYAVARILADAHVGTGERNTSTLIPRLERTFFRRTLPDIGKEMMARTANAHALLATATQIDSPNVIDTLIGGIEQSTQRMLTEHERIISFLNVYQT